MNEPRFLTLKYVLYVHKRSLEEFGGKAGVGNIGQVESALGTVQTAYGYGRNDFFELAATYAFHIAESQAFNDGNKRTGAGCAIAFLRLNGVAMPEDDGSIYDAMIGFANRKIDKSGFANVLRKLAERAK